MIPLTVPSMDSPNARLPPPKIAQFSPSRARVFYAGKALLFLRIDPLPFSLGRVLEWIVSYARSSSTPLTPKSRPDTRPKLPMSRLLLFLRALFAPFLRPLTVCFSPVSCLFDLVSVYIPSFCGQMFLQDNDIFFAVASIEHFLLVRAPLGSSPFFQNPCLSFSGAPSSEFYTSP